MVAVPKCLDLCSVTTTLHETASKLGHGTWGDPGHSYCLLPFEVRAVFSCEHGPVSFFFFFAPLPMWHCFSAFLASRSHLNVICLSEETLTCRGNDNSSSKAASRAQRAPPQPPRLSPLNRSALTDISVPSPTYFCWVLVIAQGTGQVCLAPFHIENQRLQATPWAACRSHDPDLALRQAFHSLYSILFQPHPRSHPPAQVSPQIPFLCFNCLLLCRAVLDNRKAATRS